MKGLCYTNRYYTDAGTRYAVKRLKEAFAAHGAALTDAPTPPILLESGGLSERPETDFVLFWNKDVPAARVLERAGLRVFNSARAIGLCDDKALTYAALFGVGVSVPETVFSPLCYDVSDNADDGLVALIEKKLGYPLIVKNCVGSLGRQVRLIRDRAALTEIRRALARVPHLYQRFIAGSAGRDVRVYMAGGQYLGGMRRVNAGGVASNRAAGGRAEAFAASAGLIDAARRIGAALGLDYFAADFTDTGEPLLLEVNSNAYFEGIESLGADIAGAYARHIIETVRGEK
ncbi:MAG: hypothetical protein LBH24_05015 [Clostridiales bacterium]|jgi:RimK family alpha-L-glutamate ligase|nr:hypothetical protein [Clostridiales bacterium]